MTQLNLARILGLMLVTDDRLLGGRDLVDVCLAAERGGVTSIQVRLKQASPRQLADAVRRLLGRLTIPVLVNDRLDVALATGAAGVHLGPDDVPVAMARKIVPPGFLVGASVGTEAEIANGDLADYWGVGPYRPTGTKADAGEALGPEGLRRMIALAGGKSCVAIGGVVPSDLPAIRECGAAGAAVVSGLLESAEVEAAARNYASALGPGATAPPPAGARRTSG